MKLGWAQRRTANQQRQAERSVATTAVGQVDPRWLQSALAASAANAPAAPAMVPLPPFPARQAAPSRLAPIPPSVQTAAATPPVGPGRHHPPPRIFETWGGPVSVPRLHDDALILLSPPPGNRASSQARLYGVRPDASQMQSVMGRTHAGELDHLSVSIPRGYNESYPPMVSRCPYESQFSSEMRSASQEFPMAGLGSGNAGGTFSVSDLDPFRPSADLRGVSERHRLLMGEYDMEARRISILQRQLRQSEILQIIASQDSNRDCSPHHPHDADQEANLIPPVGDAMDLSEHPPARSGLICSPTEKDDDELDAN